MTELNFSEKSLVFVTGASRGIGRCIAIEISRRLNVKSHIVLIASTKQTLEETKSMINQENRSLNVITIPLDLAYPSSEVYEKLFNEVLGKVDTKDLKFSIFVHNAGTMGILKRISDLDEVDVWKKFYDLNFISTITLNNIFIKRIRNLCQKVIVVNITSSAGHKPNINMSMYGSVKAARDLFFGVLAKEESNVSVLNYSPGPVDTDLFNTFVETAQDENMRKAMREIKETTILSPEQTVGKLLGILESGDYQSGEIKDYYDRNLNFSS